MSVLNIKHAISALALMAVAGAPAAFAQTMAAATADLNLRAGPGPQYEVIGVIENGEEATIEGCIDGSLWCRVTYNGEEGWAYSQYLTTRFSGDRVIISERREAIGVPTVTYDAGPRASVTTGAGGAVADPVVGGPVGALVGGIVGATAAAIDTIVPPERVTTYVTDHRVDPVYLDGEVVVGAQLPTTVELLPVPDYDYRYVYVNRQPVLVEPASRRIVYIYR